MIISPKYQFIFIKTQKTAGSSIEKILLDKIFDDDNLVFGGMAPENMPPVNSEYAEHQGILFIEQYYPLEYKNFFKFTVERNPWDKVVSQYNYLKSFRPAYAGNGFEHYVLNAKKIFHTGGWSLYTKNNVPVVDYVMQYSQLETDFEFVLSKIGLSYNNELKTTKLKAGFRTEKDYRNYYSQQSKDKVYKIYKNSINYFNYSF